MGFRVDREVFDPGASYSGAQIYQTTGREAVPWQPRPFSTKEEYAISNALRLMAMPVEEIRAIRPPVPLDPNPPIFGYDNVALTIEDVLDVPRWAPVWRSWVSGAPAVRRAHADEQMWSGTERNTTDPSLNPLH